jgi:hypothetical protein
MSTLRVNSITDVGGAGPTYANGHIIQSITTTITGGLTTTSTSFQDIPGQSVTITPKSLNSKILVTALTNVVTNSTTNQVTASRIVRDNTPISLESQWFAGSGVQMSISLVGLENSPSIGSITYKVQGRVNGGTGFFANGGTITVQEIAQ